MEVIPQKQQSLCVTRWKSLLESVIIVCDQMEVIPQKAHACALSPDGQLVLVNSGLTLYCYSVARLCAVSSAALSELPAEIVFSRDGCRAFLLANQVWVMNSSVNSMPGRF